MKLVQCWDDGVVDDIRLTEILRRHGAKASFNLDCGRHGEARYAADWKCRGIKEVWKLTRKEMVEIYDGFVIANHSLTHPWLTRIPVDEAERNIREGKDALEQLFGRAVKGFAYPSGDYNETVEEIIRATGHLYARTTLNTDNVFPPVNAMEFHSSCHFQDPLFWERFERVKVADGVFYFWGHSYEMMTEDDWRAFEEKIARLSAEPAEWVDLPSLFEPTEKA